MKYSFFWFLVVSLVPLLSQAKQCPDTPYILTVPADYDHLRYAPAPIEREYSGGSFVASLDGPDDDNSDGKGEYLGQPNWVATHVKAYRSPRDSMYPPSFKRPKYWYAIPEFNVERKHYKTNKYIDDSYRGQGDTYNRGHLAMRADSNRMRPEYGCNTHVFANAVPQYWALNQGIWLALENYVSSLANERGEVWVVSGPVFEKGKRISTIGDAHKKEIPVAVPDALFKVLFIEGARGVEVISFMFPNKFERETPEAFKKGDCEKDVAYDYSEYLVSLGDIENKTGLTFFPDSESDLIEYKKLIAKILPTFKKKNAVGYCH